MLPSPTRIQVRRFPVRRVCIGLKYRVRPLVSSTVKLRCLIPLLESLARTLLSDRLNWDIPSSSSHRTTG